MLYSGVTVHMTAIAKCTADIWKLAILAEAGQSALSFWSA